MLLSATCSLVNVQFAVGQCALCIKWDEQFKFMQQITELSPALIGGPNPLYNASVSVRSHGKWRHS